MREAAAARARQRGIRPARGFSLIELLVVVAIMAVLATIGMPLAELSHRRTEEEDLRCALREIRSALDHYKQLVDQGRIQRPADGSGYPPGLSVLADGVTDASSPQGTQLYLLRKLPRDPLAVESVPAEQTWGLRSYASSADDPKAGKDVYDVYSLAPGVGLNGIAYRQW
jgi:general secretion pathway protein G